jgi:hypothetical protein
VLRDEVRAEERQPRGQRLEDRDAERVEVRGDRDRRAGDLLRRRLHRAINEIDASQAARIVFITGGTFTATLEHALLSTDCLVLRKPVGMQVVRSVVRERVA